DQCGDRGHGRAVDRALSQAVVLRDPLCGHTRPHAVVVVCIPRPDGDDEVVPLVARADGCHVVEDHRQTSWMCTVVWTASRGRDAARIATTSVTLPRAPPPPAGPFV